MVNINLEEIAQKIKSKQPITNEEFQVLVKRTDWKSYGQKVLWSLNEPKCSCDSCYNSWLSFGKELYKNDIEGFEKIKVGALQHKKNKQKSIQEREARYVCSVA